MTLPCNWQFPKSLSRDTVLSALPNDMTAAPMSAQEVRVSVLDDDQWHLCQHGDLLLYNHQSSRLELWQQHQRVAQETRPLTIRFHWQLNNPALAKLLQVRLGVRAFTEKSTSAWQQHHLSVRNSDDKIIVRLTFITLNSVSREPLSLLTMQPLRGYANEARQLCQFLKKLGATPCDPLTPLQLLTLSGLNVPSPRQRSPFNLRDDEVTAVAIMRMVGQLVEQARTQEEGLIADIDSEFLHQYRVQLRKARSLVSLFKKDLPSPAYHQLKSSLKELGQRTNLLRDLDVFLLDHDQYLTMLPESLHPGLEQACRHIHRLRKRTWQKVVTALDSADYRDKMDEINQALSSPRLQTRGKKLKQRVDHHIVRQHRHICTSVSTLSTSSSDDAIHQLRIECKKLRYLLELFAELYPRKPLKVLTRELKALQETLGRFNDFTVQHQFLHQLASEVRDSDQKSSLNALSALLYQAQQQERTQVFSILSTFGCDETTCRVHQLLDSGEPS
jgi:CHAD domain-containing protein